MTTLDLQAGAIGTRELLTRLKDRSGYAIYKEAKDQKRSLTQHLEHLSPTDSADQTGHDAFTRCLIEAGVSATRTLHELGIYAVDYGEFIDKAGRTMLIEWGWRTYRDCLNTNAKRWRAQQREQAAKQQRALTTDDFAVGTGMRPYFDDSSIVADDFEPTIPLAEVLAGSRGIPGNSFRGLKLVEPTAGQKRYVRIGERALIPKTAITLGETTLDLYKYGRGIELTYEVMRREPMDRVRRLIQLIAVQNEVDKVSTVVDVLLNGDGNSGTAATNFNLTTLGNSSLANAPTIADWYSFQSKWKSPYVMTHLFAREASALKIKLFNTGSANQPTSVYPATWGLTPNLRPVNRNMSGDVGLGETDDVPAGIWLGFDRRVAVERIFELGSDIEDNETYASNQTQVLYFTENEAYRIESGNAVKKLTLGA